MKYLVVGGLGFLGSYLSRELVESGEATIFDNFTNFIMPHSPYTNYLAERMSFSTKFKYIRGDIRYPDSIQRALDQVKPDVVVHLSAIPIASVCNNQIQNTFDTNMNGTVNLLSCLKNSSVKRFVYASSSFVYGNFEKTWVDEYSPTNPIDLYGATKLAGETFTKMFCNKYGIEWVILRPSAVYGPLDCNNRVTQIMLENAHYNQPINIDGDGEQRLDFTYVLDTVEAFKLACTHPHIQNQTYNATYGRARSINEFLKELRKYYPNLEVVYQKQTTERPKRGTLHISKIQQFGYKPQYPIERGIEEYARFFRDFNS